MKLLKVALFLLVAKAWAAPVGKNVSQGKPVELYFTFMVIINILAQVNNPCWFSCKRFECTVSIINSFLFLYLN